MNFLLWTTFVEEKHSPLFQELKDAGFDGVEIPIGAGDAAHYTRLKAELDRVGLECTTVLAVDSDHDPISPDPAVRDKAREKICDAIALNVVLGSGTMCGPFHSAYKQFSGSGPTEQEVQHSAEVMRVAGEVAQSAGVIMALEPLNRFETYLLNTMAQARDYADLANHPNVKILYDTHHVHIEEKCPAAAIKTLGDTIGHVHVSENDRGTPGSGQVQWEKNFSTLHEVGYDGWLVFEAFSRIDQEFAGMIHIWRDFFDDPKDVYEKGLPFIREMWQKTAR